MRIVVLSANPRTIGGYACQTKSLLKRLATQPGVDALALAALRTAGTPPRNAEYIEIPLGMDLPSGTAGDVAAIGRSLKPFAPDMVISFLDVRFLGRLAAAIAPAKWLPWVPIDCSPMSPHDVRALEGCHTAIAMSRDGEAKLQAAGFTNVAYVPLGVEDDFTVLPDHATHRAQLAGAACTHLTLIVAANTHGDRKNLPMQIAAWWAFSRDKPGARLLLHTGHRRPGAPDLAAVIRELGIGDRVIYADAPASLTTADMVRMYNGADLLMLCSRGEGFGVPLIEAQACGVPVVVTDFSSMPELCRWGKVVDVAGTTYEPPLGACWALPDVTGILYALEDIYDEWQDAGGCWPLERRRAVSAQVHAEYGWDNVFKRDWAPLVEGIHDFNESAQLSTAQPASTGRANDVVRSTGG